PEREAAGAAAGPRPGAARVRLDRLPEFIYRAPPIAETPERLPPPYMRPDIVARAVERSERRVVPLQAEFGLALPGPAVLPFREASQQGLGLFQRRLAGPVGVHDVGGAPFPGRRAVDLDRPTEGEERGLGTPQLQIGPRKRVFGDFRRRKDPPGRFQFDDRLGGPSGRGQEGAVPGAGAFIVGRQPDRG